IRSVSAASPRSTARATWAASRRSARWSSRSRGEASLALALLGQPHLFQDVGVLAPLLPHLHEEAEEHPGAQELLELVAGLGADRLQHRAPAADEDPLLVLALDEDRGLDPHELLLLGERLDHDAGRVRDLLARVVEDPLADDLGREEALGLVGEEVLGIERRARGEVGAADAGRPDPVFPRPRRERAALLAF